MYNPYDYYITDDEYNEAQKNGISRVLLNNRIRIKGWGKKEAMTTPLRKSRNLDEYYKKIAMENGINLETFANRIKLGWSNEKAAKTPVMDPREVLKVAREKQRKYPKELLETADKNGIKRRFYDMKVPYRPIPLDNHVKWTKEENERMIELYEKGYDSNAIAKALNKTQLSISDRLKARGY